MRAPTVSIITVCRNALEDLIRTEASVRALSCEAFEWIIIDGDSNDGTRSYLEALSEPWIRWVSEPDGGIYDAMNKGIRVARGEWLWFMNAGDIIHDKTVVQQLLNTSPNVEICFGDVIVEWVAGDPLGLRSEVTPQKLPSVLEKRFFRYGMVVSHQAFIVRRTLAPGYNAQSFKLSADLDWMLTILAKERNTVRLGVLACVPRDGATKQSWCRSQLERLFVLCCHFGVLQTLLNHVLIILRRGGFLIRTGRLR